MAVDSHTTKILFCEGKPDSVDYRLLKEIMPLGQVRIVPIGGKRSFTDYIRGYWQAQSIDTPPAYIAFRDRDFDIEPDAPSPRLLKFNASGSIWSGYRTTIENYLIDVDMIYEYWQFHAQAPKWEYGSPMPREKITIAIRESAEELCSYQAVRWALAKLRPETHWPQIQTTWVKKSSGHLPSNMEYANCLEEARNLVNEFRGKCKPITIQKMEAIAEQYHQKFRDPSFLDSEKYLIWFQGKDYLKVLCPKLSENFPRTHYTQWAASRIAIDQHPDLQELVDRVSEEP